MKHRLSLRLGDEKGDTNIKTQHLIILSSLLLITAACGLGKPTPTGTPPVVQLMPDLPGYKTVEGQAIQDYIASLAEGGALLSANPQLALLIEKVDSAIACYQKAGALNAQIFVDEAFPLSSGAIAIADRNRLTDPATLFECVGGGVMPFSDQPTIQPCSHSYTLPRDDNEFYIIYVGTTQEICQTFCEHLEGCLESQQP